MTCQLKYLAYTKRHTAPGWCDFSATVFPPAEIFAVTDMSAMACITDDTLYVTCGTDPNKVWSYSDAEGFSADWASVFVIQYLTAPVKDANGVTFMKSLLLGGPGKTVRYCRDTTNGILCDVPIDNVSKATVFVVAATDESPVRAVYNYATGKYCSTDPLTYRITCDVTNASFNISYDAFWLVYGECGGVAADYMTHVT